jgi:hypothetical protein
MAKLIPSLSSAARKMTAGERRFASRLESHLDDDYLCWYDVPVGPQGTHPDFLVLHPRRGLLVVEVKDWKLDTLRSIDKLSATLLVDGREKRDGNPLEQARQYCFAVCRLFEADPALVGAPGTPYQGKLLFPWGYGVVLANISRKAFAATDLGNVIPPERVICQDEMVESVEPEAFQKRLWSMFGVTFRCLLSLPQVDRVRWHLFPEIRVSQGTFELARQEEAAAAAVPEIVRVMDLQQESLARSMGEGHRMIHGVAGSGKTMLLGYRAQVLAQVLARPILVLCFNAALAARLEHMIAERGLAEKVNVRSFHGWCMDELKLYRVPQPEPGEGYFERMVEAVIRAVERGQVPRAQYGAVLIDEGHDFEPEWLKLVAQMVDPETNSLLVLYDDAQSINRSKARLGFSFAELGIQARGRTTIMKLNYRNTAEVMAVACDFARELLSPKEAEEDGIPLLAPESAGRRGPMPELAGFPDFQKELDFVVERARAFHAEGRAWKEMAVLYRAHFQGARIADELKRAGIAFDWFGPDRSTRRYRPGEDSVKLMTFHSSKGLEFPVVIVPCLESMPYARDDVAGEAKLLYVAMTRAMERLVLTHHADSLFVGRVKEALARAAGGGLLAAQRQDPRRFLDSNGTCETDRRQRRRFPDSPLAGWARMPCSPALAQTARAPAPGASP